MIYKYLYIILVFYITFEAYFELFLIWGKKHLQLKSKYVNLKEGTILDNLNYRFKIIFFPFKYALLNKKVFLGMIMYLIHHHFILDLMNKAGENPSNFEKWATIAMWCALVSTVIINTFNHHKK